MAYSQEQWERAKKIRTGTYYDTIDNSQKLEDVKFYDMLSINKLYTKLSEKSKGGYIFNNKIWFNTLREVMTDEEIIISSVSHMLIAEKYKFNYVYAISGTHKGETKFKIGKADNPKDRVKMFNVKIPFDIETLFTFRVKDALSLERQLHVQLKEKRLAGEWFDLSVKDIVELLRTAVYKETEDYYTYLEVESRDIKKRRWKNKEEYIEYLESMLVLNNIKFKEM